MSDSVAHEHEENEESTESLCRAHYARVLQLCRYLLTDPQEAAETAQDVFVNFLRAWPPPNTIHSWEAWFTRATVNACRNRRRSWWWRWWRTEHVEFDEAAFPMSGSTPEEDVENREERERLWLTLQGLPRRQREVVALHLEGWSHRVIAEILALSVGSVKRHLFHAVRKLRTQVGEPS